LFDSIDPTQFPRSFVVNDPTNSDVLICIPRNGAEYPDFAVVWDYTADSLGVRDLADSSHMVSGIVTEAGFDDTWNAVKSPDSWDDGDPINWNQSFFNPADDSLVMASGNQLFYFDSENTQNGEDYTSIVGKHMWDFGEPEMVKLVRSVWPRVTAPIGVTIEVRVGGAPTTDAQIQWSEWLPFVTNSQDKIDVFVSGRLLSFDFRSESGPAWVLNGFDVNVIPQGRF